MAEMAVSLVIDQLLPLLREETKLLRGIHKEFADIKDELESIQAFLKDADKKVNTSEGVKTWVKQLMEAAFRIEDIIDDYLIHVVGQQPHDPGCVAIFCKLKTMIPRRRIASEIQDIKSSVREIKERSERYGFQRSFEQGSSNSRGRGNAKWHDPRMAALYIDEAEIVGFQAPKKRLIGWLVKGRAERTVISVVGMGGQGKTTLAKSVFDNKEVVEHFESRVWITVSQSYSIDGLLRGMLKELYKQKGEDPPQDISEMDRGPLISELRNYLQQKRNVFVFDDVWNIHFWDEIEHALSDNKNGSRIFITTRNMDVAMHCKKSSFIELHTLQPLTEEQSFELFNKKAFRFDFDGCCPKELIEISFEIARKCKGLPLAIVAIGGLLSTKEKNAFELQRFSENMTLELNKDSHLTGIKPILGFSYDDLPFHLKSCLLYFGMYPEDYKVESKRLIWQWIAEGFVKEEKGSTLEEVAEGYLTELIRRSLVQVSSVRIDGKTKCCSVHDLIRITVLEKCEELSFCKHISEVSHSSSSEITRRLSGATNSIVESNEKPCVRSLFLFKSISNESINLDEYLVRRMMKKYRRLKVLDLQDAMLHIVHENLGSFIHLKYLSFRNSVSARRQRKLPKSIGMLQNLETLDLRIQYCVYEIPKEISKLRKLRHLLGYGMSLFQLKGLLGGMESLQTLSEVRISNARISDDGIELIRELAKLQQLRKLGLARGRENHGRALSSLLKEMRHLEKLRVKFDYTSGLNLVSPPPMLRSLVLQGELEKSPEWIPQLQNLVKLKLSLSGLTDDPINYLENMQNLLSLSITDKACEVNCLHFHDGGFRNLKELYIRCLRYLNLIVIDKGALHSLKKFEISSIPHLKKIPSGIQHLKNLEVLNIHDVPLIGFYPTGHKSTRNFIGQPNLHSDLF